MTPRTTNTSEEEFDLSRLLWGEPPPASQINGSSQPYEAGRAPEEHSDADHKGPATAATSVVSAIGAPLSERTTASVSVREEFEFEVRSLGAKKPERKNAWGTLEPDLAVDPAAQTYGVQIDDISELDMGDDVFERLNPNDDLDALAALAELADGGESSLVGLGADDEIDDELDATVLEGRELSYAELTDRLHRQVLPRLRWLAQSNGYLTLGYFARAIVDLQASAAHLSDVQAFADQAKIPILPSRSHKIGGLLPLWAVEDAKQRFGDLVRGAPDEALVIERLGYAGLPLGKDTRAFLVQAWICHCLSRSEERALTEIIAEEVSRVGEDFDRWSPEALAAREALVLDNLRTVARMALRYVGHGIEIDDLLQFGTLGLFRAVVRFDPSLGYRFVTYAGSWIFQSLNRAVADSSRLIRLPVHLHDRRKAITEAEEELWEELSRDPSIAEIAARGGTSEVAVRAHLVTARPISLNTPNGWKLAVAVPTQMDDPAEWAERRDLTATLDSALGTLTEREREILMLRFGLSDGEARTLEECGRVFGVTRERIRQIEVKALKKLRHPACAELLREHAEIRSDSVTAQSAATDVSPDQVRQVLDEFKPEEAVVVKSLWALGGGRPRSINATAKQHRLPVELVEQVYDRVLKCVQTQFENKASVQETRRMSDDSRLTKPPHMHHGGMNPRWRLAPGDGNSAGWVMRIAAESGRNPPPTARTTADRLGVKQSDGALELPEVLVENSAYSNPTRGLGGALSGPSIVPSKEEGGGELTDRGGTGGVDQSTISRAVEANRTDCEPHVATIRQTLPCVELTGRVACPVAYAEESEGLQTRSEALPPGHIDRRLVETGKASLRNGAESNAESHPELELNRKTGAPQAAPEHAPAPPSSSTFGTAAGDLDSSEHGASTPDREDQVGSMPTGGSAVPAKDGTWEKGSLATLAMDEATTPIADALFEFATSTGTMRSPVANSARNAVDGKLHPLRERLTKAGWKEITTAVGQTSPWLRGAAEARTGTAGDEPRSRTATASALGVSRGYVASAEKAIRRGITSRQVKRTLDLYWSELEALGRETSDRVDATQSENVVDEPEPDGRPTRTQWATPPTGWKATIARVLHTMKRGEPNADF